MKVRKFTIVLLSLVMVLLLGCSNSGVGKDSKYVLMVKDGHPNSYPNATYGKAYDDFFGSPTWKYFKSTDGQDVVEFTGYCTYQDVKVKANQQFILNLDKATFEAGALSFNDVPQSSLMTSALISKAFESNSTSTSSEVNTDNPYEWAAGIKAKFEDEMVDKGYVDSKKNIIYKKSSEGYYDVYTTINGKESLVVTVNVKTGDYHG